ncbi:MAG: metallophosphoesterase family protein [Planctomycetaceae bacterium]|nr:metallophosphoesterase family protein [Planctomycetales bacterium]MCB9924259.1 metallophosphoesterase family protein [Planctomycetaceae bacterium]
MPKFGLLADVHECVPELQHALAWMQSEDVDRYVFLGDLVTTGEELEGCVELLNQVDAIGVWGNHDFEFCCGRREATSKQISGFFKSLHPHIDLGDVLASHVFPILNPHVERELWYTRRFPQAAPDAAACFTELPHRILLTGHLHTWHALRDGELLDWQGELPLDLEPESRYLFSIGAICSRRCAILDTDAWRLVPYNW